jgi:hypothetical protein
MKKHEWFDGGIKFHDIVSEGELPELGNVQILGRDDLAARRVEPWLGQQFVREAKIQSGIGVMLASALQQDCCHGYVVVGTNGEDRMVLNDHSG